MKNASVHILPYFNPRSPYGERPGQSRVANRPFGFQSTLPLRGATVVGAGGEAGAGISIHAPLTGSDQPTGPPGQIAQHFNPRSPYGERPNGCKAGMQPLRFQSTLPLRGATTSSTIAIPPSYISIHAPLTGSDDVPQILVSIPLDFNPRSPYGERPGRILWIR